MKNSEAEEWLSRLGRDRKWLSTASGYSINSLNNTFAGKERSLNSRMTKAFEKAFLEEERRKNINPHENKSSVWDLVMFTGREVTKINEARRKGGYDDVEDLYHDAVIEFCDKLTSKQEVTTQKNASMLNLDRTTSLGPDPSEEDLASQAVEEIEQDDSVASETSL
jgi:hypothetical protein